MKPEELVVASGLYGNENMPEPTTGGFAMPEQNQGAPSFSGGLDIDVDRARKRRSPLQNALLTAADLFNISASRPNALGQSALAPGSAYLGQSAERANAMQKTRMEEDPEGYQIDLNRAKVLSQKAQQESDPAKKAVYGREIKKLLPEETQGLDDLTASDFFNSIDNKLKLEQLKGYNRLQQIALQNQGKMDVAEINNASREEIAAAKNATQLQVHEIDNAIRQAIQDGKNETALALQDKRSELQMYIHQLDNAAMLERTQVQQKGAMERVQVQQAGANLRALVAGQASASGKKADAKTQQAMDMVTYLTSPEQVSAFDKLNDAAGTFSFGGETWGTLISSERGQAWNQLESYMTRGIVQLAKSLGSNPSNEDARRISNMFGLNSHMSPTRRREAWFSTLKYVAAVSGAGLPVDGSVSPEEAMIGAAANMQAPQAAANMMNIEKGKAPTGQPVTASGNYLF